MTGRVFFEKYPQLLPFMLNQLNAYINDDSNPIRPSIQSILLLLSRLYLSSNLDTNYDWKVRDQYIFIVERTVIISSFVFIILNRLLL